MRKISLIVYDFDGTLVDTLLDITDSVNLTLADLSLPELPRETIRKYVGKGVERLMSQSLEGSSFTDIPQAVACLLYTSPSPRDISGSRMPSSA